MLLSTGQVKPSSIDELLDARLLARLERLDLASRRIFAGKLQGERRSKKRGQSVEFDDYRTYTPGDDLRFIDWNVYARFERLFIKLFLEEEDLALHVAVDASASMDTGNRNKLLFCARLATALAYVGLVRNNRVGMTVFGTPVLGETSAAATAGMCRLPDCRGRNKITRAASFLLDSIWPEARNSASGEVAPGGEFGAALTSIAKMRVGKGVFVLLSDFLVPEGYERGLRALAAAGGYDTFAVQVLSPGELDPSVEVERGLSGDVRLMDIESGKAAEVTVTPALLKQYEERLHAYVDDLHQFCAARGMTHVLSPSDAEHDVLVFETLRRTGMLG